MLKSDQVVVMEPQSIIPTAVIMISKVSMGRLTVIVVLQWWKMNNNDFNWLYFLIPDLHVIRMLCHEEVAEEAHFGNTIPYRNHPSR